MKLILILFLSTMSFSMSIASDINLFQKTTLNSNRSGKIKLSYSTEASSVKGDQYKGLPFSDNLIKSTFASENNTIESVSINRNKKDTISVSVSVNFKDIMSINTASGFSKLKISVFTAGDSTVLTIQFDKDLFEEGVIPTYTFELPAKEILRTGGMKSGSNLVTWGTTPEQLKNGFRHYIVFTNSDENTSNDTTGKGSDQKSCGLFGIELPLLVFSGLFVFSSARKRRKL